MSKYAVLIGDLIIARNKAHTIVYSYHKTLKSESFRDVTIWRMWNLMGRPKPRVIIETRITEVIERRVTNNKATLFPKELPGKSRIS